MTRYQERYQRGPHEPQPFTTRTTRAARWATSRTARSLHARTCGRWLGEMPYADPEAQRRYWRERARKRRSQGLCGTCNGKAAPERARCRPCLEKGRRYEMASPARRPGVYLIHEEGERPVEGVAVYQFAVTRRLDVPRMRSIPRGPSPSASTSRR